jgi:hypothetical protein
MLYLESRRRRFAFVAGPANNTDAEERRTAFYAVMNRNGVRVTEDFEIAGDFIAQRYRVHRMREQQATEFFVREIMGGITGCRDYQAVAQAIERYLPRLLFKKCWTVLYPPDKHEATEGKLWFRFETGGIDVADVCGKSVGAAIFMALVRSLIRALGEQGAYDPQTTVSHVNEYIMKNHHQSVPYMYATLFYGMLDTDGGTLEYVNAGHLPPVVVHNTRIKGLLERSGPAVGIQRDARYDTRCVTLDEGDMVFAYTDGVTEAHGTSGVLLGRETLYEVLKASLMTPRSLIDTVEQTVVAHRSGEAVSDDITMVAFKRI